jgi:glycerophosphoryl diester phosphodiesterase
MTKILLAHRGITYNYNENTIESLCDIFNYNSDMFRLGVELDINFSKDEKIFIYHDSHINNISLNTLTYDEIIKCNSEIPLLEDILKKFINKDYVLNIEIKSYHENKIMFCYLLKQLVDKYKNLNYIFSSFDKRICRFLAFGSIKCYKISDIDEDDGTIVHYSQINNNKAIGIYTIFDKDFDNIYLKDIKNFDIIITDDIKQLLEYFSN